MTRVLFLSPLGQLGGAERHLLDLIASIRCSEPGLEPAVIVGGEGPLAAAARDMGVESRVVPFPQGVARLGDSAAGGPAGERRSLTALMAAMSAAVPAVAGYVVALRRAIAEFAPHVVHSNGLKMHILGVWATPSNVPMVWHIHDYVSRRPIMSHLLRAHTHRCAAAIAVSRSVAADFVSTCGHRVPVFPLYNAIDTAWFSPIGNRLDLDALAGLPAAADGTVRVGLLATMARWKGHETFLRAVSMLDAHLALRAYIVGGPVYQSEGSQYSLEELRAMADALGLGQRVGFTGFVPEPASAMRALDVVVHASTEPEPFGRTIAEAMACGRPVVVSDAGGAHELISNGVDSLAFPPAVPGVLARCIEILARNPALRASFGRAGRARAETLFDRSRLAREMAPIYSQLLGEGVSLAS